MKKAPRKTEKGEKKNQERDRVASVRTSMSQRRPGIQQTDPSTAGNSGRPDWKNPQGGELIVVFVELNHFLSQPNGRVLEKSASSLFSTPVGLENL